MLVVEQCVRRKVKDAVVTKLFAEREIPFGVEIERDPAGARVRGIHDRVRFATRKRQSRQIDASIPDQMNITRGTRPFRRELRVGSVPASSECCSRLGG